MLAMIIAKKNRIPRIDDAGGAPFGGE